MELAREHWKIESMHWILDVTFSEDDCRFLSENAHKSMNALRNLLLLSIKSFLLLTTRNSLLKPVCFPLFSTPISYIFYETGVHSPISPLDNRRKANYNINHAEMRNNFIPLSRVAEGTAR